MQVMASARTLPYSSPRFQLSAMSCLSAAMTSADMIVQGFTALPAYLS